MTCEELFDDLGVIVLCPDRNSGGLKCTASFAQLLGVPCVALVGSDTPKTDILELSRYARVYTGGKTITSLIDTGMRETKTGWCLVVTSGSRVRRPVLRKYARFIKSHKDILFPVVDRKYLFDEASINGILMSRRAYADVGEFGDDCDNLQEAKLYWAGRALERGYKFKALVGARLV